jgi:1-acyl-sn-glycerol-3-phosphate acyltransferase
MADAKIIPFEGENPRGDRHLSSIEGGDQAASVASDPGAVAQWLDFLRRRLTGDYSVDEFGYDADLTDNILMASLRPLYEEWFRVEVRGIENVPDEGGALIVANHSGTIALDSLMTQLAVHDHHPAHRHVRMLGANLVFSTPFLGELARKAGHTLACNADSDRLLGAGELVAVWPEGFKGVGKRFSERYKLQRFGRGGFISSALKAQVPIVPVAIVGAEETYPLLANFTPMARLLNLPYFPITPTFPWLGPAGLIPLPSKWIIEFGEPIRTDHYPPGSSDDALLVFNLADDVRDTIQQSLYRLLTERKSVWT